MIRIIAEIAQAHEGSLGIAHSYIDALSTAGVDAIKFQTHIAEAESSIYEPFRVNFSYEDSSRFDYWKRMEFTFEQWQGLKKHCDECVIEFISSPFSIAAVDLLEKLEVNTYKVGSGEVTNLPMLDKISQTGKNLILSSGMSDGIEIDSAISFLKSKYMERAIDCLSILQCTTAYPTQPEDWGLNMIVQLKQKYGLKTGFSDHSGGIVSSIAAVALGAEILEFHAVFDKRMFGPDSKASLTIDEISELVDAVRQIERSYSTFYDKDDILKFQSLKGMFEKSLCVNKDLPVGHILCLDDLEAKKPKGYGMNANLYSQVLGRCLSKDMNKWDFLNEQDLI